MMGWVIWALLTALACRIFYIRGYRALYNELCDYVVNEEGRKDPRIIAREAQEERERHSFLIMMEAMMYSLKTGWKSYHSESKRPYAKEDTRVP